MTTVADRDDWYEHAERPVANRALWRWLPLLVGVVVFEFTADAMLGIALSCLKFGIEEWRTALWLWKTDPDRQRGRACGLFHAAYGFGKVALGSWVLGTIGMVLIAILSGVPNLPLAVMFQQAHGGFLTMVAGLAAFLIVSYLAIGVSIRDQRVVWIGRIAHRARVVGTWPPPILADDRPGRWRNRVGIVLVALALLTCELVFVGTMLLTGWPRRPPHPAAQAAASLSAFASFALLVKIISTLRPRIMAASPDECWPEGDPTSRGNV
jgi:hypothetical protein